MADENLADRRVAFYWRVLVLLFHVAVAVLAYVLAYLVRFDLPLSRVIEEKLVFTTPLLVASTLVVFPRFKVFQGLWRYVSMRDVLAMIKAKTITSLVFLGAVYGVFGYGVPRSVLVLDWILCVALLVGMRFVSRAHHERRVGLRSGASDEDHAVDGRRAVIVGGGDGAESLIREMGRTMPHRYELVGIVDDHPRMLGRSIHGVQVVGKIDQLPDICGSFDVEEILIAIPSATPAERSRILQRCRTSAVPVKSVPTMQDLIYGKARVGQLQEVDPEDILGREPVRIDTEVLRGEVSGKRVLVTGAGGSIGSELCHQLALFGPRQIVLYERAESSLHFIDVELRQRHPDLEVIPVVGDIMDERKLHTVMTRHSPDIVYHAAAYKHVHLMEAQPLDAIRNNILGTEVVARASLDGGVEKCVFISTDKAVRPVGVMGRTKRAAEDLLLSLSGGATAFVSVRFGNVLGSDGSVLPLFQRQIARREPVTITDPDATRYFMLIAEAAQLVLQAGAMGRGGEVFYLNMGQPMKISDLAEGLIRLSGLKPGEDVPVVFTGLRPGERLNEELVRDTEELLASDHEKILILRNAYFDESKFSRELAALRRYVDGHDEAGALEQLKTMTAAAEQSVIGVPTELIPDPFASSPVG
ncbi:MAG: polysaccharide biosynthesis protein [Actinomycetota bacterium]